MNMNDLKIISTYTRAEAVADGIQVPISPEITREAGILYPVFMTRRVYNKYVSVPKGMDYLDQEGRQWDLLYMFALKARKSNSSVLLFDFVCNLPDNDDWTLFEKICEGNRLLREVTLKAIVSPLDLDDPQPAITILLPDED